MLFLSHRRSLLARAFSTQAPAPLLVREFLHESLYAQSTARHGGRGRRFEASGRYSPQTGYFTTNEVVYSPPKPLAFRTMLSRVE